MAAPQEQAPPPTTSLGSEPINNPTSENYAQFKEQVIQQFLGAQKEGWIFVKEKKGVKVEKKKTNNDSIAIRGTGLIKVPPEIVFQVVKDPTTVEKLDKNLKGRRVVQSFDEEVQLAYYQYKSPGPVSHRDFLTFSVDTKLDADHWVSIGKSAVRQDVPPVDKHIRGQILISGYSIHTVHGDPNSCMVHYIAQADPMGNIPAFLLKMESKEQAMVVAHIRTMSEKIYKDSGKSKSAPVSPVSTPISTPISSPVQQRQVQPQSQEPAKEPGTPDAPKKQGQ